MTNEQMKLNIINTLCERVNTQIIFTETRIEVERLNQAVLKIRIALAELK